MSEHMTEEPTEPGWYTYSGGAEVMIFHLRESGQWSVHFDNGTAADCAWGYIEQALGVWDLVPLRPDHPMTLTTKDAETLAKVLRKCRVEDGSPAPLFHEGDLMHIAHVLIASGAVRREAEVRAEAWDEGYEVGYDDAVFADRGLSTDPDAHEFPHENPYRAALAEEGDRCDNRGPRLGNEGYPRCRLVKGHAGLHKCAPVDGWGDVQW